MTLALRGCTSCRGSGMVLTRRKELDACACVLRNIFRICYQRWKNCIQQGRHLSQVSLISSAAGRSRPVSWGRKDEEYIADFELVAKRTLSEAEHRIFRAHYVLGADWRLCSRQLHMDRGNFFHAIYRIEAKLGRAFRETRPYALFPLDEYFHGVCGQVGVSAPIKRHDISSAFPLLGVRS